MSVDELIEKLMEAKNRGYGDLVVRYPDYDTGGHEDIDYVTLVNSKGFDDERNPSWVKVY